MVFRPLLLPMGDPNGITAAVPASSKCLHKTGSACMYGKMINPNFANSSVAFKVSIASGIKYFGSG